MKKDTCARRFGDSSQQFKTLLEDEDENEEWHVFYPVGVMS